MIATAFPVLHGEDAASTAQILERERKKSRMLRVWILSGLFYMALPGTLLGFSNLMAISAHHGLSALSPAWLQGHGHAQAFGWIGSFILGIGFYSQPGKPSKSCAAARMASSQVMTLARDIALCSLACADLRRICASIFILKTTFFFRAR